MHSFWNWSFLDFHANCIVSVSGYCALPGAGGRGVSRLKYLILILPIRISYIPMIPPSLTVNWHSYSPPFFILCRRQLIPPLFPQKLLCPPPRSRSYPVINRLVLQLEFIRGQLSVMNSCIYQAAWKFELSTLRRLIVWHSKNAAYTSILVIDCEICRLAHARFQLSQNAPKRGHWETTGTRLSGERCSIISKVLGRPSMPLFLMLYLWTVKYVARICRQDIVPQGQKTALLVK